jgi:hypothetical protein
MGPNKCRAGCRKVFEIKKSSKGKSEAEEGCVSGEAKAFIRSKMLARRITRKH